MRLSEDRLVEIAAELATKPRDEKVRALLYELLTSGLGQPVPMWNWRNRSQKRKAELMARSVGPFSKLSQTWLGNLLTPKNAYLITSRIARGRRRAACA